MEIENTRLFELVWICPGPSPGAAPGFGGGAARRGTLSFELAFHLSHGAHDGEETAPRGGGGIDVFSQGNQLDLALFEVAYHLQ